MNNQPKPGDKISLLFMITAENAEFHVNDKYGQHFLIPKDAHTVVFSDRPYRIAKTFAGGALHFAHYYNEIDFRDDPPNVTFAGYHDGVEGEKFTIFELGSPVIRDKNIVFPVMEWIGIEKAVATGDFTNVSLIVDNVVGDFFETVAAGLGTAAACSIGEVATAGAATAACAAAVIGTAGFIANKA